MKYSFNLINGENVDLTPLRINDNIFSLIDELNQNYLRFSIDSSNFAWNIDTENVKIINDDVFNENMTNIVRQLILSEQVGVEETIDDEHNKDPFNPEEISIDTKPITMETLMRRLQQGTIILNPDFQRNEVWDSERKSQLIESLLLKIPIPMFYVSSDEKSNWTVVDGLQRISTLRDFVLGKQYVDNPQTNASKKGDGFKLHGLEFWNDLENSTLNSLKQLLHLQLLIQVRLRR